MPRRPIDYSKCMIYKLACKDPTITDVYVGHTTDRYKRKYTHRFHCMTESSRKYNYFVYQFIRDHGGFDNWDIIMLEEFPCENIDQALVRERYWFEQLRATLNKQVPSRTIQEYKQANRQIINEKKRQKIECECGHTYSRSNKSVHIKSKKHLENLQPK
jgi:hypothetical protein